MKKQTLKENINSIKSLSSKLPKTINEAINFNECGFNEEDNYDSENDYEISNQVNDNEESQNNNMDVMQFVDDIRKKSLRGMAQLADNPDDERYQLLKKIWQICDKKPEQQNNFDIQPQKMIK